MDFEAQLITWGSKELVSKGYTLRQPPETIVETPWSTVVCFTASNESFYLKQTPADLFIETQIIRAIQQNYPQSLTPRILAENSDYHCYLMKSCGDYSLRTKFNGVINKELLIQGLDSYIKVMRSFEDNYEPLKMIGVPDWRIHRFPELLSELLAQESFLQDEGLSADEIEQLRQQIPQIELSCEYLAKAKVKQSLVNGDFNENNLIFNESTGQIAIIDWGESVITHPFLSIAGHLRNNARRYQLDVEGSLLNEIKHKCISCWLDVATLDELEEIYELSLKLLPIFSVLAIYRLQSATKNKSKEKQNWFIGGFLKSLLKD